MNELIVAEKPSVALRIAQSLSESPKRAAINGVSYYELQHEGKTIYVVAAVGHLFTLKQKKTGYTYPVFDIEWTPSYSSNKSSYFTKKYLDVAEIIGMKCNSFINACDYDLEGTVIGTNIIKAILKTTSKEELRKGNVKRMKFSTTTNADLLTSYNNIENFDYDMYNAGESRHMLDWMWGINMSRALMHSLRLVGINRIISIGRVQGPTLAVLSEKEMSIKNFKSKPYWKVFLTYMGVRFENKRGDIFDESIAKSAVTKSKEGRIYIKSVDKRTEKIRPNPPFDLTTLQLEASRTLKLDPSKTLALAQSLYERSYISYPRTTSQKLPYALNLPKIINDISKNPKYAEDAKELISKSRFKPAEGAKEDEAHPSIFPTGIKPAQLSSEEESLYDLIVRRFLACFAEYATVEKSSIIIDANGELYWASGTICTDQGWMKIYGKYTRLDEKLLPAMKENDEVKAENISAKKLDTLPPKRYTKATLIALLERKDLGTKATRSEIIDTLFKREYIKNSVIEVTGFGLSIYQALSKYCPDIINEDLTRRLEKDMDKISKKQLQEDAVIKEGEEIITKLINDFNKNEKEIANMLKEGLYESESANALGKCPKCGGNLVIKRSKLGKNFVACSNWPECTVTYPLPANAKIVPTKKVCEICHTPIVKVFRKGKRPFEMDLDPNCSTKSAWKSNIAATAITKPVELGSLSKTVPNALQTTNAAFKKPEIKNKKIKSNVIKPSKAKDMMKKTQLKKKEKTTKPKK
jgi:DNA topoisomerase-1